MKLSSEVARATADDGDSIDEERERKIVMEGSMEKVRRAEIETVKHWFKPNMRVLDIGGGNGYQSSVVASWGCDVASIDISDRPIHPIQHHQVQDYDER